MAYPEFPQASQDALRAFPQAAEKRSVILIEDDASTRSAIVEALRDEGHQVYEAACVAGAHGLCCAQLSPAPDVALVDFVLPDGSGRQVALALRERWPEIALIYCSALRADDDDDLWSALQLPASSLLEKPTSLTAILSAVECKSS